MGIVSGDRVWFVVQNGNMRIVRELSIADVAGSIGPPTKTEDLEKVIREAKEDHFDRRMRRLGKGMGKKGR